MGRSKDSIVLLLAALGTAPSSAATPDVEAIARTVAPVLAATTDLLLDDLIEGQIARWVDAVGVHQQLGAEWRPGDPDWQRVAKAFTALAAEARGAYPRERYESLLAEQLHELDADRGVDLRRLLAGPRGAEILHNERDVLYLSAAMADDSAPNPGSPEWLDRMDELAAGLHLELPDAAADAAHAEGGPERRAYEAGPLHDALQKAMTFASRRARDEVTTAIAQRIEERRGALEGELLAAVDSFRSTHSK